MIGIDLIEYERFNLAISRSGLPFLHRILRAEEMEDNQESMWAVIFSAKETFIKVVGGMPPGSSFQDIEIILNSNSTFTINTFGSFQSYMERRKLKQRIGEILVFQDDLILTMITSHSVKR